MKVYVDKIKKDCFECPLFHIEEGCCGLDTTDEFCKVFNYHKFEECNDNKCPLQPIQDHDKEVRKQVCDEIRNYLENDGFDIIEWKDLLDQIEKGGQD